MFAQETGRNITGAAYRFKEVRALFRAAAEAMSAEGELTFLREMASPAPASSRGPQAPPSSQPSGGVGARGGPSWLRDKRSFSLKRPREEGASVEARAPNKKGKSPPNKKGKPPPKTTKSQKKANNKANNQMPMDLVVNIILGKVPTTDSLNAKIKLAKDSNSSNKD